MFKEVAAPSVGAVLLGVVAVRIGGLDPFGKRCLEAHNPSIWISDERLYDSPVLGLERLNIVSGPLGRNVVESATRRIGCVPNSDPCCSLMKTYGPPAGCSHWPEPWSV